MKLPLTLQLVSMVKQMVKHDKERKPVSIMYHEKISLLREIYQIAFIYQCMLIYFCLSTYDFSLYFFKTCDSFIFIDHKSKSMYCNVILKLL